MVLALSVKRSIDGEEVLLTVLRVGLANDFVLWLLPPDLALLLLLFHSIGGGDCSMDPGVVAPSVSTSASRTLSNGPPMVVVNGHDGDDNDDARVAEEDGCGGDDVILRLRRWFDDTGDDIDEDAVCRGCGLSCVWCVYRAGGDCTEYPPSCNRRFNRSSFCRATVCVNRHSAASSVMVLDSLEEGKMSFVADKNWSSMA